MERRAPISRESTSISGNFFIDPLIAAVIGFVASAAAKHEDQAATLRLEEKKFQSSLVLTALQTPDSALAASRLRFLIRSGLLPDPGGTIMKSVDAPSGLPSFDQRKFSYESQLYQAMMEIGKDPTRPATCSPS